MLPRYSPQEVPESIRLILIFGYGETYLSILNTSTLELMRILHQGNTMAGGLIERVFIPTTLNDYAIEYVSTSRLHRIDKGNIRGLEHVSLRVQHSIYLTAAAWTRAVRFFVGCSDRDRGMFTVWREKIALDIHFKGIVSPQEAAHRTLEYRYGSLYWVRRSMPPW